MLKCPMHLVVKNKNKSKMLSIVIIVLLALLLFICKFSRGFEYFSGVWNLNFKEKNGSKHNVSIILERSSNCFKIKNQEERARS